MCVKHETRPTPPGLLQCGNAGRQGPRQVAVIIVPDGYGIGVLRDHLDQGVSLGGQARVALRLADEPPPVALLALVLPGVVQDDQFAVLVVLRKEAGQQAAELLGAFVRGTEGGDLHDLLSVRILHMMRMNAFRCL